MTEDWSTSSYSGYNGDCVQARFRKSSHSANGNCTEVRMADGRVQVRDSKNPAGPVLTFTRDEWEAFTAGIRATS